MKLPVISKNAVEHKILAEFERLNIKKIATLVFAVCLVPLTANAATASQLAAAINTFAHGGSGTLDAVASGNVVTVTGSISGATARIALDIDQDVTVEWKANYSGNATSNTNLITLSGNGTFKVSDGGIRQTGASGRAIGGDGANATVIVSGGTVSVTTGRALNGYGASSIVTVSGGKVIAATGYAISAAESRATVIVSGGIVFAEGATLASVINNSNFPEPTGNGVVVAWNRATGTSEWQSGSSSNLSVFGTGAIAIWDFNGGKPGISYERGTNTGFIAVAGVTVNTPSHAVTNITGVPETVPVSTPLVLEGTIVPGTASDLEMLWSIVDAGSTGAVVYGNILQTSAAGTIILQATVRDGKAVGEDYRQFFIITVVPSKDNTPIRLPQIATGNQATQIHNGISLQATNSVVVEVYGLNGNLVSRQNFGSGVYTVPFGHLPKGMYIVKAVFGGSGVASNALRLRVPVR